jgi:hypothetical protein
MVVVGGVPSKQRAGRGRRRVPFLLFIRIRRDYPKTAVNIRDYRYNYTRFVYTSCITPRSARTLLRRLQ